jgi:SAM-dependent methyltransferase
MAISWRNAQKSEERFWKSIYIEKRTDLPTYQPVTDESAYAFTKKSVERFGQTMDTPVQKTIADIGCGPYGLVRGFHVHFSRTGRRPARIYGVDPLIDTYLQFGSLPQQDYIQYMAVKAEAVPLDEALCDFVYSTNVIDHVENPDRVINECKRICRPGGEVLISVHVANRPFHVLGPIMFLIDKNHPHHFSEEKFVTILRRHFGSVQVCDRVSVLDDQPDFAFLKVFRSPRILRGLKRWLSTFLLTSCYIKCTK